VVLDKKQVAVLVPTTILAQQHLVTFTERFKNHAVNIKMVNRFKSPREQKQTLAKVQSGEVDIIIGTHRLLSRDVSFAQLGLIIIDEEQRFGVKHKEVLKKMRNKVDILTLTATPIPRTLHFSLMGVRDLSIIETPPIDRLSIKTFVRKFDEKIIHDSIKKELERGGQVYFVHNKINSIHSIKEMIQEIVPEARIGIGHGQLPEHKLEEVMGKFIAKEIDVLLCTTIIESGLDIPSANTIIINRADQFGLAQLYQLRGRVGRYKYQAYAYLLIPGALAISSEARQRLNAIEELSELGAGFQLAARDMEIRGVGNMLGRNQSGHIASIGFDLYSKLIEETVRELKGEEGQRQFIDPEINLQVKGFIPKNYIPDLNQRLDLYRRLQLSDTLGDYNAINREIMDRYGRFPESIEKLLSLVEVKTICRMLHIKRVYIVNGAVRFDVERTTPISSGIISGAHEAGFVFVSEFCLGLNLKRKNWKEDMLSIADHLKVILRLVDDVQ
jgi:transcription-repair coupling factor (superfamily II helicase)